MKKQDRIKKITLFVIISALLVFSIIGIVYAYNGGGWTVNNMDQMHDIMTKNLDPGLKEQMDIMHEGCRSLQSNVSSSP